MVNKLVKIIVALVFLSVLILIGNASKEDLPVNNYPSRADLLKFDGESALLAEQAFVNQFPNRDSGQPNNRLALEWLDRELVGIGLECEYQDWDIINYSKPVHLNNLVCELVGDSPKQIVLTAHHDQAPMTIQGADNDGSGVSVLLELAKIFSAEESHPYSLVFLFGDGEEYGMLGSRHYVKTHGDPDQIIAGFSLDNVGKYFYSGMDMSPIGQFGSYGNLWLQRLTRDSAVSNDLNWVPMIRKPLSQAIDQAVPISFMDQGPMVASGIPALGFAATYPPEFAQAHWETFHTPADTLDLQSADSLQNTGRIVESSVRQIMSMNDFPLEQGGYVYFESSESVLRGSGLWVFFVTFTLIFLVSSIALGGTSRQEMVKGWKVSFVEYLSLWLPILAGILLLYLLVEVGMMYNFHLYPATNKDPILFTPTWSAVALFVSGLTLFFYLGRKYVTCKSPRISTFTQRRSFAFFVIGISFTYVLFTNPFSLLGAIPLLSWFLIKSRKGYGRAIDIALFLLGGIMLWIGLYHFGVNVLKIDWAILWYVMMMFSIQMVTIKAMFVITAVIAAGLSLVVSSPRKG